MADNAEICPESVHVAKEMSEGHKENTCGLATEKDLIEKVNSGIVDVPETAISDVLTTTENTPSAVADAASTETAATQATAADTTDESLSSGIKRKSEDDKPEASDDLKKVKSDEKMVEVGGEGGAPAEVVHNGSATDNGCHAVDASNGKDVQDIPAEIVTKTIDDAMKPSEDAVASS